MSSDEEVFGSGPDFSLNACVGDNTGSDDDYGYVVGFAQAALALIAIAKRQYFVDPDTNEQVVAYQDALIYPICFNARHHIELFLKRQIQRVASLRETTFDQTLLGEHELRRLLEELMRLCELADRRLPGNLQPLRSSIEAFAEIDPTGQAFRYRRSREDELHLGQLRHINLAPLEQTFKKLYEGTEEFERQVDALSYEYDQGTVTPELSRLELAQLAKALPPRSTWASDPKFDEVKRTFVDRFGLSGNAFSRAVDLIQKHHEFSGYIGVELPLAYVDAGRLRKLVALEADALLLDAISNKEWVALDAVYEVGHLDTYPELFAHRMRQLEAGEHRAPFPHDVVRAITTVTQRFRRGLIRLGQKSLLAQFDAGLAAREPAAKGEDEDVVAEFNRAVRRHFLGELPTRGKYAPDSVDS
jgi:hypothetical protein